ncbi:hypothetical protein NST14_29985 [Bacillus sp. FSL W8-0519]|uniref:hypothetical protein n=1 Tax=Bacillus sp. FSL W8-0519 TaxID=2954624 RepID=UPI0030FC3816
MYKVAELSQDYASDGAAVSTPVTLTSTITKDSKVKIWLSGDFNEADEIFTLKIEGNQIYSAATNSGQDEILVTKKESAHYLGEFSIPASLIGKQDVTVTGMTSPAVNNSKNPAARSWVEIWSDWIINGDGNSAYDNKKRGYQIPMLGNRGRGIYSY